MPDQRSNLLTLCKEVERPKFVDKSPLISYPLRATTFLLLPITFFGAKCTISLSPPPLNEFSTLSNNISVFNNQPRENVRKWVWKYLHIPFIFKARCWQSWPCANCIAFFGFFIKYQTSLKSCAFFPFPLFFGCCCRLCVECYWRRTTVEL